MMAKYPPILVTPPANDLLTASEVKAQSRIDFTDDDTLIDRLIGTATAHLDGWSGLLGRCLINQTWRQPFTGWCRVLRLPFPDVSSITSVSYSDADGNAQTVDASLHELSSDHVGAFIRFKTGFSAPSLSGDVETPVSVTFVAGYGADASAVPAAIRHAALMLVAHWYENREPGVGQASPEQVQMAVASLIEPYRRVGF